MIDPKLLNRVLVGFHTHADRLIRDAAVHCDGDSFEAAWISALYVLDFAARGDFHGKVQILYKGESVRPLRVVEQDVPVPGRFADVYGAADDNMTRPARSL